MSKIACRSFFLFTQDDISKPNVCLENDWNSWSIIKIVGD